MIKKFFSVIISISVLMSTIIIPSSYASDNYDYKVEAEFANDSNWRTSAGSKIQKNSKYSNGKYLNLFTDYTEGEQYYTEYTIDVDKKSVYELYVASTPIDASWSSPIYVSVNDEEPVMLKGTQIETIPGDTMVSTYKTNSFNFNKGSNNIKFIIQEARADDGKAVCYLDWFGLKESNFALYAIKSEAPLQTFEQKQELKFTIEGTGRVFKDTKVVYDVVDYNGQLVESGQTYFRKGSDTATFTLKQKKKGSYQIYASCNGNNIVQQFLVVTNLSDRKEVKDSPFAIDALPYGMAVNVNKRLVEDFCDLIQLSGVKWIRDRVYFDPYIAKNGDKYSFSMPWTGVTGEYLNERDVKVEMTMDFSPQMLRENDYGGNVPTNLLDVYEFWKQLAENYDGKVALWEIQNESDLGGGGVNIDGADTYASMFKAAALGIIDSNTQNEVYVSPQGAAAGPHHDSQFARLMFENEIYDYTDIVNYHAHRAATEPYSGYYEPTESYDRTVGFQNLKEEFGVNPLIWNSESGISLVVPKNTDFDSEEQLVQAKYLVTSYIDDIALGADKRFYFDGLNYQEGERAWGMTSRSKYAPSAYAAWGSLSGITYALGEGKYINKIANVPENVSAHAFSDMGETVIAFWSNAENKEKVNIEFNLGYNKAVIYDMFGNEENINSDSGIYQVTATDCPQYIKVSGNITTGIISTEEVPAHVELPDKQKSVDAAKRVILLQQYGDTQRSGARLSGYNLADDSNKATIAVYNFNDFEVTGEIVAESKSGWEIAPNRKMITVPAMSMTEVDFDIMPDGFRSQDDRITFYGNLDCGTTSKSVIWAKSKRVVDAQPTIENGVKYFVINLENRLDKEKIAESVLLTVGDKTAEYFEPVKIEGKSSQQIKIPIDFDNSGKDIEINAEVKFTDGSICTFSDKLSYITIKSKIDTSTEPDIILPDDGTVKSAMYYGKDDLYAKIWLAADSENLYMTIDADDNIHSADQIDSNIWNNDGIQFAVGKGFPGGNTKYFELGMSLTEEKGVQSYCWSDGFGTQKTGAFKEMNCKIIRNESQHKTIYEISIPWKAIDPISFEDGIMSFSMLINENDGMGRVGYIEWGSGIGNTKNPAQFRTLLFSK